MSNLFLSLIYCYNYSNYSHLFTVNFSGLLYQLVTYINMITYSLTYAYVLPLGSLLYITILISKALK